MAASTRGIVDPVVRSWLFDHRAPHLLEIMLGHPASPYSHSCLSSWQHTCFLFAFYRQA
jgi:hypothetical protein